jgi:hypothetical protein
MPGYRKTSRLMRAAALCALAALSACSFTTAHISDFSLSKDEAGKNPTTKFGPLDTFYARAVVSNVPSKVTLKWRFFVDKVEGQKDNSPLQDFDRSFDLPTDGQSTYHLSPPNAGWPPGTYRIEVGMFTDGGEEKDHKAASFSVVAN